MLDPLEPNTYAEAFNLVVSIKLDSRVTETHLNFLCKNGHLEEAIAAIYSIDFDLGLGKRPTNNMFKDHLNLHNFVKALLDQVMEIVDPYILLKHNTSSWIKDCMFAIMRIGDGCSMESPRDQMETESEQSRQDLAAQVFH
ncbi:hypothetical protein ACSBR2_030006 [Camellia fascicularis]